jgi:sorbitol-specific phosphotransferase system component IIBC
MSETEPKTYKKVLVEKGSRGWGGPLTIEPKPGREYIVSITGGGIHPLAQKIAELTGGIPFDGFKSKVGFEQMACVVIDCGGTARVGVYPMKKVPTIDIYPTSPAGPLMMFIKEEVFVSGVKAENLKVVE